MTAELTFEQARALAKRWAAWERLMSEPLGEGNFAIGTTAYARAAFPAGVEGYDKLDDTELSALLGWVSRECEIFDDDGECGACDGEGVPSEALADHERACPDFRTDILHDRVRCLSCFSTMPFCPECADYSPGRARPKCPEHIAERLGLTTRTAETLVEKASQQ